MAKKKDLNDILNKASSTKGLTSLVEVTEQDEEGHPVGSVMRKGRKSDTMMDIIHFDIEPTDNTLVAAVKEHINRSNITRNDIYKVVPRSEGYNMYLSLKKGQLQWNRAEKWATISNSRIAISFIKNEDEED